MATRHLAKPRRQSQRFLEFLTTASPLTVAALALLFFAAGCASPGEPTARKPPVPQPIGNLVASRSGNFVLLAFAVPQNAIGGAPLEHAPTVEIYRDFEPAPASGELQPPSIKRPSLLTTIPAELVPRYTAQGQFRYSDQLNSADFTNHPDSMVVYSVRTRVSAKRPSALSNLAALRLYPASDPISDLKGQITPSSVLLSWTAPQQTPVGPIPPLSGYRIYRGEAQEQPSAPSNAISTSSASQPGLPPSPPALSTPLAKIGDSASPSFSDTDVEFGNTYVYSVRSVLDYSGTAIESSDSNFLVITPRDTFPPAAPAGLIGILVPAAASIPAHVDLSWAVSPEPDLSGYRIYRSEQAGVLGTSLQSELLLTPAFRDMNVASGSRYFYSVTAVDRAGNESSPSAAVSVSVPTVNQPSHD